MSGMFYSVKEAAEKLKMTEKEVRKLIKEDKLREFRIGSDMLLKAEEVNSLAAEKGISVESEAPAEEQESVPVAPETTEPEAGEVELGKFELPESEAVEPESPVLDMADLESLNVGDEIPASQADVLKVETEDITAVKPKATSKKRRSKTKQKVARTSRRRRLSLGQWLWRGLLEDSPGVIILLFLLLGGIIAGCLALGTVLSEML